MSEPRDPEAARARALGRRAAIDTFKRYGREFTHDALMELVREATAPDADVFDRGYAAGYRNGLDAAISRSKRDARFSSEF